MKKSDYTVNLLGTSFVIKTDEEPEYISRVLKYLRLKTAELEKSMALNDPLKIAIISSILITDELFKARDTGSVADFDEAEKLTLQILERIDQSLSDN